MRKMDRLERGKVLEVWLQGTGNLEGKLLR
jgi:hypothetical protein